MEIEMNQIVLDGLRQALRINPTTRIGIGVILGNSRLSLSAKAIALTILCHEPYFLKPSTDRQKEEVLLNISKEKIDTIRLGVKELEEIGLLQKEMQEFERRTGFLKISQVIWKLDFIHEEVDNEN